MTEKQSDYGVKVIDKRMQPETEVAVSPGPNAVVMMAMQKGYDPAFIEKMMDLQERHEANEARKAYHKAMAAFKANPPKIWRDLQVKYEGKNTTGWNHADLGKASEAIGGGLAGHGLNHSWKTEPQEDGKIKVTCFITHELGHNESTWLVSAPDKTGSKNDIQAIGSAIFYLERYTLFAITGLAPVRMDDDGQGAGEPEFITEKQLSSILDMINSKNVDETPFLKYMKVEAPEKIQAKDFDKAIAVLKKAKGREREPGE